MAEISPEDRCGDKKQIILERYLSSFLFSIFICINLNKSKIYKFVEL